MRMRDANIGLLVAGLALLGGMFVGQVEDGYKYGNGWSDALGLGNFLVCSIVYYDSIVVAALIEWTILLAMSNINRVPTWAARCTAAACSIAWFAVGHWMIRTNYF